MRILRVVSAFLSGCHINMFYNLGVASSQWQRQMQVYRLAFTTKIYEISFMSSSWVMNQHPKKGWVPRLLLGSNGGRVSHCVYLRYLFEDRKRRWRRKTYRALTDVQIRGVLMFQFYTARWDPSTRLLSGQNGELVALSGQNVAVCNVEVV